MSYESFRITYQSSEAAARAAYEECERLRAENAALKHDAGLFKRAIIDLSKRGFGVMRPLWLKRIILKATGVES